MTNIKDPIHGYIELNELETTALDTLALQRLREIKQLGMGHIVYPSATHTRFSHTLGVLATVQKYAESLDLKPDYRDQLRIAALFHDTGHGPYSHLSEQYTGIDHEQISCNNAKQFLKDRDINTERVCKMIKGELEISQILHGDVDADRLDYLQRDSMYTGVDHGQLDTETIIQNAEIDSRRLVYNEKAVPALENLLVARHHMTQSVYHHHASRIADKMMMKAFDQYTHRYSKEQLMNETDASIQNELIDNYFYNRIRDRYLYKRAGTIYGRSNLSEQKVHKELVDQTGLDPEDILVDKYRPKPPELDVKIKKDSGEITTLKEESKIVGNLEDSETRIKIYSDDGVTDQVAEAVRELYL